jgi:hypothetical protein
MNLARKGCYTRFQIFDRPKSCLSEAWVQLLAKMPDPD